ncbi:serine/threonine-protein kinase [Streptomyces sp. NPDC001436]
MPGIAVHRLDADDPRRLGDYHLLWRLDSGGMGRIYLARPEGGGPLVAVKTLLARGPVGRVERQRFAREVELARRVDGAYTARVLDADPAAARPWMAIQYVPAPSLADLVREHGPLAAWAVPSVAAGVVQALVSLHSSRIVHRDVKPQNVLLPLTGPLVIDFGISHAVDRTRTSLTLGTVAFTSPEQARGEASTAASDVFSLGATLFHLAVGRPPYGDGLESAMVLLAHVQGGRVDLTGLPGRLAPLIEPCLAHDPRDRPDLATVLATAVSAQRRGRRWLPVEWTATITAYEAHGRALDAGPAAPRSGTGETPADSGPPRIPQPTDPGEAAARQERERRAEAARRRRAEEARRLARHAAGGGGGGTGGNGGAGVGGWAVAAVLLAVALLAWQPWTGAGGTAARAGSGPSPSAFSSRPAPTRPLFPTATPTTTPTPTPTPTPSVTEHEQSTASTAAEPPHPTPSATRDLREEAFQAVTAGSCLPLYDTGVPGKWNADTPPGPVRCDGEQAHVQVGSVTSGDCPSGAGRTNWRYKSTNLCLTRIFRVGYCLLAKAPSDGPVLGTFTLVDCQAPRIPADYDYILHITGVYRAPANPTTANCRRSQGDSTDYRSWTMLDASVLLCTTFYHHG